MPLCKAGRERGPQVSLLKARYGAGDYKLDSCSKKQTTVSPKGCSALATTDTPAAVSEKPSEK